LGPDGGTIVETDLYLLKIDPVHGGRISSLIHKLTGREFVDVTSARSFNEYRGYFGKEGRWLSSVDSPAAVTIEEAGPLRVTIRIDGHIGPYPFHTRVSCSVSCPRIDVRTSFDFPSNAQPFQRGGNPQGFRIGEPWPADREVTRSDRRPLYDSSYKLQALFPAALKTPVLHKNAPFDVCRSTLNDTTFNSWSTLQHNVILDWVDIGEADGSAGLAMMTDHTTAYSFSPKEPLGLVCCYAGQGNWFDYTLGRQPNVSYSIVPHAGDWEAALVWQQLARWSDPLVAAAIPRKGAEAERRWSLAESSDPRVHFTSLYQHDGQTLIRIFNASRATSTAHITLAPLIQKAELLELDGRVIAQLPIETGSAGRKQLKLSMPQFGVRTVRLSHA